MTGRELHREHTQTHCTGAVLIYVTSPVYIQEKMQRAVGEKEAE